MSDITGFAKLRPGAFKDELNALLAKKKKTNHPEAIRRLKDGIFKYVSAYGESMTEKAVEFRIAGGYVMGMKPDGEINSPICSVDALPAIKEKFRKDGITAEWVYDRGKLNGKLIFRW